MNGIHSIVCLQFIQRCCEFIGEPQRKLDYVVKNYYPLCTLGHMFHGRKRFEEDSNIKAWIEAVCEYLNAIRKTHKNHKYNEDDITYIIVNYEKFSQVATAFKFSKFPTLKSIQNYKAKYMKSFKKLKSILIHKDHHYIR